VYSKLHLLFKNTTQLNTTQHNTRGMSIRSYMKECIAWVSGACAAPAENNTKGNLRDDVDGESIDQCVQACIC
jgi:hypothetical protein